MSPKKINIIITRYKYNVIEIVTYILKQENVE
jgi:hypothetical protein